MMRIYTVMSLIFDNEYMTAHLFDRVIILDGEESCCQQDLQLRHDHFAGFVDADEGTDNIARFARSELCTLNIR